MQQVKFKHIFRKGHPIASVGVTKTKNGFFVGVTAVCNRQDQFSYKISRKIIEGRLNKVLTPGENPRLIWAVYQDGDFGTVANKLAMDILDKHYPGAYAESEIYVDIHSQVMQLGKSFEPRK